MFTAKSRKLALRRTIWAILVLVAAGGVAVYVGLRTYVNPFVRFEALWENAPLTTLRPQDFERQVARDMAELAAYRDGLARANESLAALAKELPKAAADLAPEQRRRLKETWVAFLDYHVALETMKGFYQAFPGLWRWSKEQTNWRHARSFAIAYLLHVMRVDEARRFVDAFAGRADYESVLDEADPAFGIPAGSYAKLKLHVIHVQTFAEIEVLHRYHESLRPRHYDAYLSREPDAPDRTVVAEIDARFPIVKAWYEKAGVRTLVANAADIAKEDVFDRWFPIQKGVAEWMGDTRVARRPPLVTLEQVEREIRAKLEPGDVILERREWYLSNVGLPGFWPHAVLYLGSPEEFAAYMAPDPEVQKLCEAEQAKDPLDLVAKRFPKIAARWREPVEGHPVRVIEAVSEGVILNSLEHSCLADHVSALRPRRLSKAAKLRAILAAFAHWSKPYDFNFDFVTDDTIVCSELVYKAYRPDAGQPGLSLALTSIMGRRCLPANEILGKFIQERGREDAELDFVCFLRGDEGAGRAHSGTADELVATYGRPKWEVQAAAAPPPK